MRYYQKFVQLLVILIFLKWLGDNSFFLKCKLLGSATVLTCISYIDENMKTPQHLLLTSGSPLPLRTLTLRLPLHSLPQLMFPSSLTSSPHTVTHGKCLTTPLPPLPHNTPHHGHQGRRDSTKINAAAEVVLREQSTAGLSSMVATIYDEPSL